MIAKFVLIVVIFSSPLEVRNYIAFFGETEASCHEARDAVRRVAKDEGDDIFAECFDMKRAAPPAKPQQDKPTGDPKTERRP